MYHADRSEEKRYSQAEGDVEQQSEPSSREAPCRVERDKERAAYLPVQGDRDEGSTLRAACFACRIKSES